MKLAYIMPGDYDNEYCKEKEIYLKGLTYHDTEIKVFTTGATPFKSITSVTDMALIAPGAIAQVTEAEKKGYDGVVLGAT